MLGLQICANPVCPDEKAKNTSHCLESLCCICTFHQFCYLLFSSWGAASETSISRQAFLETLKRGDERQAHSGTHGGCAHCCGKIPWMGKPQKPIRQHRTTSRAGSRFVASHIISCSKHLSSTAAAKHPTNNATPSTTARRAESCCN
jgi:hypothetical protein